MSKRSKRSIIKMPPLLKEDLEHVVQHVSAWNELLGARLFVTGGTGFFGCWLLETFCYVNEVLGLSAQATVLSRDPQRFLQKMPHLAGREYLHFIEQDVRTLDVSRYAGEEFSHVIHAATTSSAQVEPLEMFDTVVGGTRRVLDLAVQSATRRFLFASSGAVYGVQSPQLSHVNEEYSGAPNPLDVRSAYAEGKRAAEYLCCAYNEKFSLSTSIARCFAFVGPHLPLDAHFAVGNFIRDAINGGPIRINGDGTPRRSYLYAADLAAWLWEILLRGRSTRAYNVGSEQAISILETAQTVAACVEPSPEIIVAKQPQSEVLPSRYVPSTQRAREELNLQQIISLRAGVLRTMKYLNMQ